jgi:hypothetical protein
MIRKVQSFSRDNQHLNHQHWCFLIRALKRLDGHFDQTAIAGSPWNAPLLTHSFQLHPSARKPDRHTHNSRHRMERPYLDSGARMAL